MAWSFKRWTKTRLLKIFYEWKSSVWKNMKVGKRQYSFLGDLSLWRKMTPFSCRWQNYCQIVYIQRSIFMPKRNCCYNQNVLIMYNLRVKDFSKDFRNCITFHDTKLDSFQTTVWMESELWTKVGQNNALLPHSGLEKQVTHHVLSLQYL